MFLSRAASIYHGEESEKDRKGRETIVEKWMETLAEVRVPRSGDELLEAYYHRTMWWYDLSLSINPCRVLGLKFTRRYENVYCGRATVCWLLFCESSAATLSLLFNSDYGALAVICLAVQDRPGGLRGPSALTGRCILLAVGCSILSALEQNEPKLHPALWPRSSVEMRQENTFYCLVQVCRWHLVQHIKDNYTRRSRSFL